MPVPLTGRGDTVGVWAHWSLQCIRGFCGSSDWLQEKFGVFQTAPVEEGEAACPWQAGCMCPPVPLCAFLVVFAHWTVVKGRGLKVVLLVCCQGGWSTSVALPLNCCPGLFWTWASKGGKFSCLPPYSLHFLDAFTLFPISLSVLLLSKQIKIEFLL